MESREVGGGRAPRQPGQVRKEAAATSFRSGRSSGLPPSINCQKVAAAAASALAPHVRPVRRTIYRRTMRLRRRRTAPACSATCCPQPRPGPPSAAPYRVLARKYRPTRFDDLIGQEAMVRTLRNAFAIGRVAHAFMLTGVRGVGKTTTARIIARALNCTGPDGTGGPTADPCGVCPNCVAILADRHPDVMEMDAASRTGVDDVREIIEATRFRPLQARTKVFVIDEVHMLSRNAFNALLKTLEEPPPHVKFVFATTEIRKVPVTVLSRCQRFDLRRVAIAELSAHFARIAAAESVAIAPEALALIARAADGSVRDGLSLLDQAIAQAEGGRRDHRRGRSPTCWAWPTAAAVFDLLEAVMAGQPAAALAITDRALRARRRSRRAAAGPARTDPHRHAAEIVPALRDSPDLPEAERTRGAEAGRPAVDARAGPRLADAAEGRGRGGGRADRRAAAEMVLIRLCHVADLPTPGDLVRQLTAVGSGSPSPAPSGPAPKSSPASGAVRAAAGGAAAAAIAAPDPAPSGPRLSNFRDVVAFVAEQREATLHAHLVHSVHLVRFAPAGHRVAAASRSAARPRAKARQAAARSDRRPLDDRALAGNRRGDARRTGRSRPTLPGAPRPPSTRWCGRSSKPFPARASTPCTMRPPTHMDCPPSRSLSRICRTSRHPTRNSSTSATPLGAGTMKNLAGLMKQASQMQAKMQEMQAKLESMEVEGASGAGMVSVTLNGRGEMKP